MCIGSWEKQGNEEDAALKAQMLPPARQSGIFTALWSTAAAVCVQELGSEAC